MPAPKDRVYYVWGKFALTAKGRLEGDVSFSYFVTMGSVPDNPVKADFTMPLERITGLFVAEINFEVQEIKDLASDN